MFVALISGGAGFIGSHLCKKLLEKDLEVICVDNLLTGDKKNIEPLLSNPRFRFLEYDVTKEKSNIKNQISKIDYVFHLASPASPNKKSPRSYVAFPIETLLANSLGTYNLLELARDTGAKFLYTSSSEVYGDPLVSPQTEDYFGNVNPNGIRSVYDEGKRFGESMTLTYHRKYHLDVRIVRIFNTYGPNMQKDDGRVVSSFINQALSNQSITIYGAGTQTRSFCYIDDMVEGILLAMISPQAQTEVINLGNPNEITIRELATIIKEMCHSNSQISFEELPSDDPKRRCPDVSKARKLLGFEPKTSLEEGLAKTIEYFKSSI